MKYSASVALQVGDNGSRNLIFGIGGPYGHSSDVRSRADEMVKLSDMVLNHQVRLMGASLCQVQEILQPLP